MEDTNSLLTWINTLLKLEYAKVDQLGNGAAYCQVMDSIYGKIPMSRLKFHSCIEYDYLQNYKVLYFLLAYY